MELTAPGGVVAMLVPAKLATAGYGATARHELAASMTLTHLVDLTGRPDAAFEATVYPLALIARKSSAPAGHRVRVTPERRECPERPSIHAAGRRRPGCSSPTAPTRCSRGSHGSIPA